MNIVTFVTDLCFKTKLNFSKHKQSLLFYLIFPEYISQMIQFHCNYKHRQGWTGHISEVEDRYFDIIEAKVMKCCKKIFKIEPS